MFRTRWLYMVVFVFSLFLVGSLALISSPARAAYPSGASATARQAIESDLGLPYGPKQNGLGRKVPQGQSRQEAGKPLGSNTDGHDECWTFVSSPSPSGGAGFTVLTGVDAVSSNDVWAVGNSCIDCGTDTETQQTLIEHWNGSNWSVVPSPNVQGGDNFLNGVVAFNRWDAWAVGEGWDGTRFQSLILHWDGSSWSRTPSPNPGPLNNYLNAISGTSRNDIWAVGTYRILNGPLVTLVEHYNGHTWSVVTGADPGTGRNVLDGVTALSPNNVWAAGIACDDNPCTVNPRGLIEHWDGHTWSVVRSPNPGDGITYFQAISASAPNDIWAVAWYCVDSDCAVLDLVVEHYDGDVWSVVSTHPFPGSEFSAYWGVLALSKKDVWIPGSYSADNVTWTNLLRHWDGHSWSNVPISSPGAFNNDLRSIATVHGNGNLNGNLAEQGNHGQMWSVGDYDSGIDQPFGYTQVQQGDACR